MVTPYVKDHADELRRLGELIRGKRLEKNISARQAAAQARLSEGYLFQLEHGSIKDGYPPRPSYSTLQRLDGVLGLNPEWYSLAGYAPPLGKPGVDGQSQNGSAETPVPSHATIDPEQDERRRRSHPTIPLQYLRF
ncbi:MAG: helix-turn-helix transcriptional regulator [Candidatus Aenigmarchaeota archaeon]|nr:helix-turn-helix transcriptional regulator [Candidatus Aenigmarchaeota archaeon]